VTAKTNSRLAKRYCANYGKGSDLAICAGIMIAANGMLWQNIEYAGKKCFADEKCAYFIAIVHPGIPSNEH